MGSQNLSIEEKVDRLHEHIGSLSRRVADLEGVSRWSHALLEQPEVRSSVREDFEDLLFDHLAGKGSILTRPIP